MRYIAILPAAIDWAAKVSTPSVIASGSLSLQILLASMAVLSSELWRLLGELS
jgi:hypothetical protein